MRHLKFVAKTMLGALFASSLAAAQTPPFKKYLLIPVDDRPATTQFAVMIGEIANIQVEVPPPDTLGKFTNPGSPEKVLDWLEHKDLSGYDAVIVSTDMLCYGGLIASRRKDSTLKESMDYLGRFVALRKNHPKIPFYAFSAIMRLSPTAIRENEGWREFFIRAVRDRDRFLRTFDLGSYLQFTINAARVPEGALAQYDWARVRNTLIQQELLRQVAAGTISYLILGQDDAQEFGPHVTESQHLHNIANKLDIRDRAYFCEGIDQHSNVLLSRAMLAEAKWSPRVSLVYADSLGAKMIPAYESTTLGESLKEQVLASGARFVEPGEVHDFSLYVNTPNPRGFKFREFIENLTDEVEQNFPVAVADINLGKNGTGDPLLFDAINQGGRPMRLLSYAGWNTAGNTLGTAIPAANVYLCARTIKEIDPLERELQQRAFLLHRLINDFEFHRYTRPAAYKMIAETPGASRDETDSATFDRVNSFVSADLQSRLQSLFDQQFLGKRFFAGTRQYELEKLENVQVHLPWPRPWEVAIDFSLEAKEVL